MNYVQRLVSIACFICCHQLSADAVITAFFREFPTAPSTEHAEYTLKKSLGNTKKLARTQLEGVVCRNLLAGIWGTYAGFLELSNADGQLTFPRKHPEDTLSVIITPKITPIIMFEQTIHHWELAPDAPMALYRYKRKQDDETHRFYWQVTAIEKPANNIIPLDALVLLAKPSHIYVPEGITLTHETPSLLLPPLYVKRGFNLASNTLYLLNINHLFSHARSEHKKEALRLTTQIAG